VEPPVAGVEVPVDGAVDVEPVELEPPLVLPDVAPVPVPVEPPVADDDAPVPDEEPVVLEPPVEEPVPAPFSPLPPPTPLPFPTPFALPLPLPMPFALPLLPLEVEPADDEDCDAELAAPVLVDAFEPVSRPSSPPRRLPMPSRMPPSNPSLEEALLVVLELVAVAWPAELAAEVAAWA
jgi:protein TonB